ncbi:hypothetical protein ACVWZZ_006503 [Bradyrhizobium sp. LM6.10]
MRRILPAVRDRHLMCTPKTFDLLAVDLLGAGPALRAAQHDHRRTRTFDALAAVSGVLLDRPDAGERDVERVRHGPVHQFGIVALDEQRLVAEPVEEIADLFIAHPPEHGRIGNLVAVEMQDRQHRAVMGGIEELVGVPGRCERAGLGLAVADDTGDDQVGIVEGRAIGMHQRVTELAAFMDRARRFRRRVAGNAAGEGELSEQLAQSVRIACDIGIDLAVAAFEIGVGDHAGAAVAGTADIDHAQVQRADDAVEMGINEVQTRRRAPMAEQTRLDVLGPQGLAQQRVVEQVDLPDGEIVRSAPVAIEEAEVAARRRRLSSICHVLADLHPAIVTNIDLRRLIPDRHQTKSSELACCARSKAPARNLGGYCAWGCFSVFCLCS